MPTIDAIASFQDELVAIRRHLHANPELGLDVPDTAALVARTLAGYGVKVTTGVGGHGIVGTIDGAGAGPAIGLRADMDALPIEEATDLPWRSTRPGKMHACGHDGHTTMLLGAAKYLAATRAFNGTAHLIFQPGEEGAGGALAMLADGLFERFPCDAIYGLHNRPALTLGDFAIGPGPFMAGGAFFDITIVGRGAHGGMPDMGVDSIVAASQVVTALQTIVARAIAPIEPAVLSITSVAGGNSYNVMPTETCLRGTARALTPETLTRIETLVRRTVDGVTMALGATARIDWRVIFSPLHNVPAHATAMADAAAALVGEHKTKRDEGPAMVSEDFAFMLERVPGAYIHLGIGEARSLHHPAYAFNDEAIPYGSAFLATLVERAA